MIDQLLFELRLHYDAVPLPSLTSVLQYFPGRGNLSGEFLNLADLHPVHYRIVGRQPKLTVWLIERFQSGL